LFASCGRRGCCARDTAKCPEAPQLKKALNNVKKGDVLVVWKLDRLGRSLGHLIEMVSSLREKGIGFASVSESIDTTTPGGKLFFHMMGALAEFERDLIVERTKAGMDAARSRGQHLGRPKKLDHAQIAIHRAEAKSISGGNHRVAGRPETDRAIIARARG